MKTLAFIAASILILIICAIVAFVTVLNVNLTWMLFTEALGLRVLCAIISVTGGFLLIRLGITDIVRLFKWARK